MAVGDAMGYTVDNRSWSEIQEDYGPNGPRDRYNKEKKRWDKEGIVWLCSKHLIAAVFWAWQ